MMFMKIVVICYAVAVCYALFVDADLLERHNYDYDYDYSHNHTHTHTIQLINTQHINRQLTLNRLLLSLFKDNNIM